MVLVCANLAAQTPPAAPHFEVASVKPENSDPFAGVPPEIRQRMSNQRRPGLVPMPDPGRVHIPNWTLLELIASAYSVLPVQVEGPPWLTNSFQGFVVEAKVPAGAPKEQVHLMLQSLLEERFGLQAH